MTDDPQLTVPIVDCFSNLNLPPDLTGQVQDIVLDTLNSASIDDLPVLVGFLLQSVNASDAQEVVKKLRQKLDFGSVAGDGWDAWGGNSSQGASSSQRGGGSSKKKSKVGITLTLEAIKSAIRFKKELVEAFFKQIQSVESSLKHKVLDLWVLFILHTMVNQRKAVVACFRKKITSGQFTPALLKQSIVNHADALREYFRELVSLAEGFLRSMEPSMRRFGVELYTLLFIHFQDKILRQDILGSIATHIGASGEEINSALEVLMRLSENALDDLVPFSTFLKGILDYIDSLTDPQLRNLFSVFSSLAFIEPRKPTSSKGRITSVLLQPNELIHDDMQIFIRKQLMNSSLKYKRMGIIGAVSIIKRIGASKLPNALEDPDKIERPPVGPLHNDLFDRVKGLIELVYHNCGNSQICVAFFYDELVNAMNTSLFSLEIVEFIFNKMDDDVRSEYILQLTKEYQDSEQLWGSVEGAAIVISMYPLAAQPNTRDMLLGLCPLIRVLQVCTRMLNDNSLDQIEGLLGCPFLFYPPSLMADFKVLENKEPVTLCLFHAINWCRELINAFANVDETSKRTKVVNRLEQIIELEAILDQCLETYPAFKVPHYVFWSDPKKSQILLSKKKKTTKKGPKKKGEDNGSPAKSNYGETPNVNVMRGYLRQFDISALFILTYTFLNDSIDSQSGTSVIEIAPLPLRYLLEDLHTKLSQMLVTQKKSFPVGVHKQDVEPPPPPPFLSSFPDPRLGLIEMRPIFGVLTVHFDRVIDALLGLKSKVETETPDSQSQDEEKQKANTQTAQLRKVWKESAIHILSSFEKLFSYEDLYSIENELIIRSIMQGIIETKIQVDSKANINFLDTENPIHADLPLLPALRDQLFAFFERFADLIGQIGEFDVAVAFVNMMAAIVRHKYVFLHTRNSESVDLRERVSDIAGEFLKKKWETKLDSQGVSTILGKFLDSKPILPTLTELVALLPEVTGNQDSDNFKQSSELGTLTEETVPAYFMVLFNHLTKCLQGLDLAGPNLEPKFNKISQVVDLFKKLLASAKYENVSNTVVACALRTGKVFLETFIKRVFPIFSACFKDKSQQIIELFRPLQAGTRVLQSFCDHGKIAGSTALLALAPALRKVLESLVYKVELLFASSDFKDAFSLGTLRHKDLKGAEVSSQTAFQSKPKKTKAKSPPKPKKTQGKAKGKGAKKGKKKKEEEEEEVEEDEEREEREEDPIEEEQEEQREPEEIEEEDDQETLRDEIEEDQEERNEEEEEDIDETED
eukprot:Phypoly_transcript_00554.p1 GENE.Phypoly_transcript_00554~~Phypoly_transcript_00554.p1  ORF type:complete len:1482 (-),score=307.87 Phypoly_transcript_00554:54-3842(-)